MKFPLVLLAISVIPVAVNAAPTITFEGEVSAQTCETEVNKETNSIVLLPNVSVSELSTSGSTAGLTPFDVSIKNCTAPTSGNIDIKTKFLGHNVTTAGNLANLVLPKDNGAENVAIQITENKDGTKPVELNDVTEVSGLVLKKDEATASHTFGVQYISEKGSAKAGKVQAIVEYTIGYL
ncbi:MULTISPECIES: fimbrial protein [unclassified Arsenophonus]|uniref:fimbrial protein n=1 Tax=unclassified Arsenophonus TaxID=2627083 RepID=UPI002861DDE6|nr:fimbrial protein [Arsenophonus sp.]MDR5609967.1 fimbrial protein [Arsenophonus sp.]MDR5613639.1 fimbrial protein [Arsenophonus sp.]